MATAGPVTRVALVADPQLTDFASYHGLDGWRLRITEFYSDLYMKRIFRALQVLPSGRRLVCH